MKNRILAMLTLVVFLVVSCSGIDVSEATNETNTNTGGGYLDNLDIEFTGNPAYDIGLLNAYWDSEKNTAVESNSLSANRAINGFGDLVNDFTAKNFLTWGFGAALTSGISTLVSTGVTKLLDITGIVKSTSSYLAEISKKLDAVQKQLNTMQAMLVELNAEVQKQGELTRFYNEMQKRTEKYNSIYTNATTCWNRINDMVLSAALASQYGKDTTEYNTKLNELNTQEKKLAYIKTFIDQDSWNATDNPDLDVSKINFVSTEAGNKFRDYLKDNEVAIGEELSTIIKDWGSNANTGANSVIDFCKYLTATNHGLAGETFTMFDVYDEYAKNCFVWERDGYNWRQQMRDQDAVIIGLSGILAYMYFAVTDSLGTSSTNCELVKGYEKAALDILQNNDYKIVRHSTPIYQKSGKWNGQIFAAKLETKDYVTACNTTWCNWDFSTWDAWTKTEWCKYTFDDNSCHINNASRIYGVYPNPTYEEWRKAKGLCKEAIGFAMPEEWYQEIFDSYAIKDKGTGNLIHKKSLIEIFRDAGFRSVDGGPLTVNIPTVFEEHSFQQLFITSKYEYAKIHNSSNSDQHYITISAVWANRAVSIFDMGFNTGISDHTIPIALFEGDKYAASRHDGDGMIREKGWTMTKVVDAFKNRHFYYPKKISESVAEE